MRRKGMRELAGGVSCLVVTVVLVTIGAPAKADVIDVSIRLLAEHGVQPTSESIGRLLESSVNSSRPEQVERLLRQLGDNRFRSREAAMHELSLLPILPIGLLRPAVESEDPEVRWRARQILRLGGKQSAEILYAAFYVVHARKCKGLARPLLDVAPYCHMDYLRINLRKALAATVSSTDTEVLRQALKYSGISARIAAMYAFNELLGSAGDADLLPLLDDANDQVRWAAAEVLAKHGSHAALPTLAALLESDDSSVRNNSVLLLREVTGKWFAYSSYMSSSYRKKQAAEWQGWIERQGRSIELTLPSTNIPPAPSAPTIGKTTSRRR